MATVAMGFWSILEILSWDHGNRLQVVRKIPLFPMVMRSVFESESVVNSKVISITLSKTHIPRIMFDQDTWELHDPVRLRHKTNHHRDKNQFSLE